MKTIKADSLQNENYNSNKCIVKPVTNINDFAACEAVGVLHCSHMVNYGYTKFCFHPEWNSFIINSTEK